MRRSLAGLFLLTSCVLFAVSVGFWWMHNVAFSPSSDAAATYAILGDAEIRGDVATLIASADAGPLNTSTAQLKEFVEQIARLEDGAALMGGFVESAHARLIGDNDDPVIISPVEQYTIVRDERAAIAPELTLPVPQVGSISLINTAVGWITIVTAAAGLLLLIAGFLTRPERGEFTFGIAVGFGTLAVLLTVLGFLIPVGPLASLSDTTWAGVFPRLANRSRNTTLLMSLVSAVVAGAVLVGTAGLRQRRQKSTPLSVGRYREQHSWSR